MASSVYIHIPFCKQKCKYCSFISFVKPEIIADYISALLKEIDAYYKDEPLKTLYFGGGTPSLIDINYLQKIIDKFNLSFNCEITLEMNPDDANLDYLLGLKSIGVNRLSIGSQTFNDKILSLIGRRHNSEQTINAVKLAKQAGFDNISLDLIYGLPTQTPDLLDKDLEIITNLEIQHVSTYGLKIEEESYWGNYPPKDIPDEDFQADMYLKINKYLEAKGYTRYEISNFALKGCESNHNLNYWNNNEYYGFGMAAHGYINNCRYSNFISFNEYLNNPLQHKSNHFQSNIERLEEEIFLGFRKESGLDIESINKKFNINFNDKYKNIIDKYVPKYIEVTTLGYKLTLDGILLSNNVLADFLD